MFIDVTTTANIKYLVNTDHVVAIIKSEVNSDYNFCISHGVYEEMITINQEEYDKFCNKLKRSILYVTD